MFSSLGWPEVVVLVLVALVIFGPDRLPGAVKQAGSALRSARETITGARKQMRDEFGDIMPDIDPAMLNPRAFVKKHLLEDLDLDGEPVKPAVHPDTINGSNGSSGKNGSTPVNGATPGANGNPTVMGRQPSRVTAPAPGAVPAAPVSVPLVGPPTSPIATGKSPVVITAASAALPVPPVEPATPFDSETT